MVKIIADSTCDLSDELLKKYDIDIIPLYINLGDDAHMDGKDVTPDEIYAWSDENKTTPKTAAFSIEQASEAFLPYIRENTEIICFSISSQMSAANNVMRLAAQALAAEDLVTVIDSASLSTGIGLQVIEAAIMAQQGKTAAEISAHIVEIQPQVRASFVVDTLTYLHRGGRCSGMAAFAGSALKLHPMIVVEEGKMSPSKKYRGKMKHVLQTYVEELKENLLTARPDRVFITHSGCDQEMIDAVYKTLDDLHYFDEILITRAGGVISSHCGPGTLGVLFIAGK